MHRNTSNVLWVILAGQLIGGLMVSLPRVYGASADELVKSGIAKYSQDNFDGAIADFTQALTFDPKNAQAYYGRGIVKKHKSDLDGAIADFTQALTFDPKNAQAYNERGLLKRFKQDLDGAITDFTQALAIDPKYIDAYGNRGIVKGMKGDLDGALVDFTQILTLDPKNAHAYINRGDAKADKGDLDGAIADYTQVLTLNPKNARAYASRGYLMYDRHAWTDALGDFRRAIELTTGEMAAYKNGLISYGSDSYLHIYIWLIRARLKEQAAATQELQSYWSKQSDQERWPMPIIAYLTGKLSEQSLLAKAQTADSKITNNQTCEASFYIGSRRQIDGDQKGAQQMLEQAVQRCPHEFTEYRSAVAELAGREKTR